MKDIQTMKDVKQLVDRFYDKVNQDQLLSPVFNEIAQVDWQKHLPIMYNFWGSILLGTSSYSGQPFPKHMALPIKTEHFSRWMDLFLETIDENFKGPKAEEAIQRAHTIALIFQSRMGLISPTQKRT